MEPSPESTNWNLPQPAGAEQRPSAGLPSGSLEYSTAETRSSSGIEQVSLPAAPQFSVPQSAILQQQVPQGASLATASASGSVGDDNLVAADNDHIEREWVDKAKKIVEQSRQDPYLQTRGLTELKSSYLQKRYGKTLKVDE